MEAEYVEYLQNMLANLANVVATDDSKVEVCEPAASSRAGYSEGLMLKVTVTNPDITRIPPGFGDAIKRLKARKSRIDGNGWSPWPVAAYEIYLQALRDDGRGEGPFGIVFCDGLSSCYMTRAEAEKLQREGVNDFLDVIPKGATIPKFKTA